jgi:hypothetical protein
MAGGPATVQPWRTSGSGWGAPPAGGAVPRTYSGGPGFVRIGGRPGAAVPPGAPPAPGGASGPVSTGGAWTPPPIPPGLYSPIRDAEAAVGKSGTEQALSGEQRQVTNQENNYATSLSQLGQREQQQKQAQQETLARLADSYKKLGARQEEGANAMGELSGGALIQSAMKRSANEGVTRKADEVAAANQAKADEANRGQLTVGNQQNLGALQETMLNQRNSQSLSEQLLRSTEGNEAASHGYGPEEAGGVRPYERGGGRGRGGFVRVGGRPAGASAGLLAALKKAGF